MSNNQPQRVPGDAPLWFRWAWVILWLVIACACLGASVVAMIQSGMLR